ncbi:MAG: efflux RND transporter periplasmic adaptor subunit [Gammaproteobacteria bacterium]|nr:efflux RND transporter periplasmic adaptor subunit [Gammaproteobacteria bacterium]
MAPALISMLAACGGKTEPAPQAAAPPEVTVAQPLVQEITEWDEYTGRMAAVDSVEVRARVSGYLKSVHFKDGVIVDKGDLLFVIDRRPYQAALNRAAAQANQAATQLKLARDERERAERLFESRAVSEEELNVRVQAERGAAARLEAAQAGVSTAELDLSFTRVRAPIGGRISRELVTEGNLISGGSAGSTLLTTIVSLDPIYVYFPTDEYAYLRYARTAGAGKRPGTRNQDYPVRLQLADEDGFPHKGHLDFIDNRIDEATGTMMGRAVIPNPDYLLVPGLFARVELRGQGPSRALLIPDAAIGTDQAQKFVYVINEDNLVARKRVVPGERHGNLRVITDGLAEGDRVIVKGVQRATPGAKVQPQRISLDAAQWPSQAHLRRP